MITSFEACLIVLLNAVYLVSAKVPALDGRIVGGKNASILDFPYQISLRKYGQHICGGSIFHTTYVLTAAHCVSGGAASDFSIRAGSNYVNQGGKIVKVCTIRVHENYNQATMDNDIAILKVCSPLVFTDRVLPVALPAYGEEVAQSTPALVSGWGYEREDGSVTPLLKQVEVPIILHSVCKTYYSVNAVLTDNMICAGLLGVGGKDACQGDSGGPLRASGKLLGVVSWGFGCARPQYPGVYTKVSAYRNWIRSITNY